MGIFLPAVGVCLVLPPLYFRFVRHKLVVERVEVTVHPEWRKSNPAEGRQWPRRHLVVAHLSDFHYDTNNQGRMDQILREALEALKSARPDVIVLTGDYVDCDPTPMARFCRIFADELRPRSALGVYACLGNHDAYGGKGSADHVARCLEGSGVTVLRNQTTEAAEGVWIAGLEDLWSGSGWEGHAGTMRELSRKGEDCLRLVLSHNPDTAQLLRDYRYDIQFSGHTHGGQICLPSFVKVPGYDRQYNVPLLALARVLFDWAIPRVPFVRSILVKMRSRRKYSYVVKRWDWAQGLHQIRGSKGSSGADLVKYLYTTRGVGTHKNMRLFCPPELTLLTVQGGDSGVLSKSKNQS